MPFAVGGRGSRFAYYSKPKDPKPYQKLSQKLMLPRQPTFTVGGGGGRVSVRFCC